MKEFEFEPGEHLVAEARKHWLLFVAELLPFLIMVLVPFLLPVLMRFAPPLAPFADAINYHDPIQRAVLAVWLLLTWTGAWASFTRYFLNLWVLTNERIVEIHQRGFFRREVSSLLLPRVQDVTTDVSGVLPSLLGIGTIKVQTAGADIEFLMRGIPRPEQMRDLILKYVAEEPKNDGV